MRFAILISGRGSNMAAILAAVADGRLQGECVGVLSNVPTAGGLEIAKQYGVPTAVVNHRDFMSREAYEMVVSQVLLSWGAEFVVLAGYMRLVGPTLLGPFLGKMVNIHPSLLPDFKGLHAQRQALAAGVSQSGCTVHWVDDTLDGGEIIDQAHVPVLPNDTEETLTARILEAEHRLYGDVLSRIFSNS
jgi:phosphoribosylglycinamide formyltransferase-1